MRARSREPEPRCANHGNHGNKNQRRAGKTDQTGGRGVQAAKIQVHQAASCGQRSPQVYRKRQGGFAGEPGFIGPDEMVSACRRGHPGDDQNRQGEQREQPPDQP